MIGPAREVRFRPTDPDTDDDNSSALVALFSDLPDVDVEGEQGDGVTNCETRLRRRDRRRANAATGPNRWQPRLLPDSFTSLDLPGFEQRVHAIDLTTSEGLFISHRRIGHGNHDVPGQWRRL